MQSEPATHEYRPTHDSPSCVAPGAWHWRFPVPSIAHILPASQPHCGDTSLHGAWGPLLGVRVVVLVGVLPPPPPLAGVPPPPSVVVPPFARVPPFPPLAPPFPPF